jgi:parallel beta-helix repeat protein
MNRILALILIIALVFSALIVIQFTNLVTAQADSNITIKPGGSIEGTDKIQRNGNVYTLTDDVVNSTVTVTCSNVVLDGSGFTLHGTTGWVSGISAINLTCSNVTVKNFNIVGFWEAGILGVYNGNTIISNNITKTDRAISIYADNYHIESNYLSDNHIGVRIEGKNNNVTQNHIVDNYKGFRITNSSNNNIVANIIEENMEAITTDYGGFQVYHNNFINQSIGSGGSWETTILLTNYFGSGVNVTLEPEWDNGYPSGGNYWSDYATKYPNATEIGDSGIGDTAYIIGIPCAINSTYVNTYIVEAIDRYPLMTPFAISAAVIPVSAPKPAPSPEPQPAQSPALATITAVAVAVLALGAGLGLLIYHTQRKTQTRQQTAK